MNDFNIEAMENKRLNVFNTAYVLAHPASATDVDYERVEGVIGHYYFHNWKGNRVTCSSCFTLPLNEGLTVFRDQQFSADISSKLVKRIESVASLRATQLGEDTGPMSHPIRPEITYRWIIFTRRPSTTRVPVSGSTFVVYGVFVVFNITTH